MRHLLIVMVIASTAAAESPPTPGPHVPQAAWSIGGYFNGHAASLGPTSVGGAGGTLELALGRGRLRLFGEATLTKAEITDGMAMPVREGYRDRVGVGVRYLARSVHLDKEGGLEMTLDAGIGVESYHWSDAPGLHRPDFSIGWATQVRMFRVPLAVSIGIRLFFARPIDDVAARSVCRGTCPSTASRVLDVGFSPVLGVTW